MRRLVRVGRYRTYLPTYRYLLFNLIFFIFQRCKVGCQFPEKIFPSGISKRNTSTKNFRSSRPILRPTFKQHLFFIVNPREEENLSFYVTLPVTVSYNSCRLKYDRTRSFWRKHPLQFHPSNVTRETVLCSHDI